MFRKLAIGDVAINTDFLQDIRILQKGMIDEETKEQKKIEQYAVVGFIPNHTGEKGMFFPLADNITTQSEAQAALNLIISQINMPAINMDRSYQGFPASVIDLKKIRAK